MAQQSSVSVMAINNQLQSTFFNITPSLVVAAPLLANGYTSITSSLHRVFFEIVYCTVGDLQKSENQIILLVCRGRGGRGRMGILKEGVSLSPEISQEFPYWAMHVYGIDAERGLEGSREHTDSNGGPSLQS